MSHDAWPTCHLPIIAVAYPRFWSSLWTSVWLSGMDCRARKTHTQHTKKTHTRGAPVNALHAVCACVCLAGMGDLFPARGAAFGMPELVGQRGAHPKCSRPKRQQYWQAAAAAHLARLRADGAVLEAHAHRVPARERLRPPRGAPVAAVPARCSPQTTRCRAAVSMCVCARACSWWRGPRGRDCCGDHELNLHRGRRLLLSAVALRAHARRRGCVARTSCCI